MARKLTLAVFALFVGIMLLLGAATFVEKFNGTAFAASHIYQSWWFVALWTLLAVFSAVAIVIAALYKRKPAFLLHCSFIVILLGAFCTFTTAKKGYIHLREGVEVSEFQSESGTAMPLPFGIELENFAIEYYSGTQSPADYKSIVRIQDRGEDSTSEISMNNILSHKNYRFYQSSFDEDGRGSIFAVNYDPLGIPLTYGGYILLGISMIWLLVSRKSGFRKLLKHPCLKRASLVVLAMASVFYAQSATPTVSKENAAKFGELQMLYNGRIAPVQTFARDFTLKIYGKPSYKGLTPEQVLAGWIFYPEQWQFEPIIKIKDEGIKELVGSRGKYSTFGDFFNSGRNYKIVPYWRSLNQKGGQDKRLKAVMDADEKIQLIIMLQAGELLEMFPFVSQSRVEWISPAADDIKFVNEDSLFVRGIFPLLYESVTAGNSDETGLLIGKISAFQKKQLGERFDSEPKIKAELLYNNLNATTILYRLNLTLGLLAFIYFCASMLSGIRRRWMEMFFAATLTLSFVFLTVNMCLRWYVSGHIPLSNGYETMMFIAWSVMFISILFHRKLFLITASGLIISGFALLVATLGIMNPQITKLMPVLASPWLSLHVSLIMVSYALFAFIMLNGLIALILILLSKPSAQNRVSDKLEMLQVVSKLFLYPAVFFLAAGIFVGAVWANVSWGRYWGWDPKEVWALITMMLYSLPFHSSALKRFKNPLFFHSFGVWAFFSVLMTYFGVNYFLGGIHSYAGGAQMDAAGIIILSVIVVLLCLNIVALIKYKKVIKAE